jgi:deoxyribonuclease (pyrimidine dimer)
MTRINCIPVELLPGKALVAEYREMLRLRHVTNRRDIPSSYRMGTGHVKFFYDKGGYLINRHRQLRNEMTTRGYSTNYELDLSSWPDSAMNNWKPTVDAKLANVARIINRTAK